MMLLHCFWICIRHQDKDHCTAVGFGCIGNQGPGEMLFSCWRNRRSRSDRGPSQPTKTLVSRRVKCRIMSNQYDNNIYNNMRIWSSRSRVYADAVYCIYCWHHIKGLPETGLFIHVMDYMDDCKTKLESSLRGLRLGCCHATRCQVVQTVQPESRQQTTKGIVLTGLQGLLIRIVKHSHIETPLREEQVAREAKTRGKNKTNGFWCRTKRDVLTILRPGLASPWTSLPRGLAPELPQSRCTTRQAADATTFELRCRCGQLLLEQLIQLMQLGCTMVVPCCSWSSRRWINVQFNLLVKQMSLSWQGTWPAQRSFTQSLLISCGIQIVSCSHAWNKKERHKEVGFDETSIRVHASPSLKLAASQT